jgi:hypothetical protein
MVVLYFDIHQTPNPMYVRVFQINVHIYASDQDVSHFYGATLTTLVLSLYLDLVQSCLSSHEPLHQHS